MWANKRGAGKRPAPQPRRIEQWLMGLPITHNMATPLRFPSSSSSNVHLTSASVQVSKRPEPPWTWFRSHKVLTVRGLRSCVQESKRKTANLYIDASTYMHSSSPYIKDNPLRVKVRESLGHLGRTYHKYLIINTLAASKKRPRRGFASWTSWTPAILGTRTGLPRAPRTPWSPRRQPLMTCRQCQGRRHGQSCQSPSARSHPCLR